MFYVSNTPDPVTGDEALGGRNAKPLDDSGFWHRKEAIVSPPQASEGLFDGKFSSVARLDSDLALSLTPSADMSDVMTRSRSPD